MGKYHARTRKAIGKADDDRLGVRLGALCFAAGLPVQVVARWVGVTRQGVYGWFLGVHDVAEQHQTRVTAIADAVDTALLHKALPAATLEQTIQAIKKYRG